MKAKAVSVPRDKRGLRRVRGAEPPVVGPAPQTTNERKTDTMKTYILRDPNSVEPQKAQFIESIEPQTPTSLADVSSRGSSPNDPSSGRALFTGLDVHNDSIAVTLAPSDSTEVRRYGVIGGSHDDVLKLAKKLHAAH